MIITPETLAKMGSISDQHKVAFSFSRISDTSEWQCQIRDQIDQVVSIALGDDRSDAAEKAIKTMDFSLVNRTPSDLAKEVADLKAELAKKKS